MQGPRETKKEEFKQVLELANYVFRKSRDQEPNMGKWYWLLFNEENLENLRIITEDNKPVSLIGISESQINIYGCEIKIGSIGSVCTHPDYRKRGFASLLLKDTIKKLDNDKVDVMLISGSRGLYKRAGCVEVGKIYNFKVSQKELNKFNSQDIKILPYKEENLQDIIKTYQKEPVRFFRSQESFKKALSTGAAMNKRAEIFTIHTGNTFLGYIVVQVPEEKEGKRVINIVEYAGVRKAIIDSTKHLFKKYSAEQINFNIPFYDTEFIYLLREKTLELIIGNIPGHTVKIINFARFMKRLYLYIEERLGRKEAKLIKFNQKGNKFFISSNKEQIEVEENEFTKIIFGVCDWKEIKGIPEKGKLAKVLKVIFPLSFIWPGLNYV